MAINRTRTLRGAVAGAVAAATWAAQQPLDKRAFGFDHDDALFLGRLVARGQAAYPLGLALHVQNGALFGAVYASVAPLLPVPPVTRGALAGLAEHLATWPLTRLSDRLHPARDELPQLAGDRRAFWQATWRHLLFGIVLGELERRLNPEPEIEFPAYDGAASTNGHGNIEHAMSAEPAT